MTMVVGATSHGLYLFDLWDANIILPYPYTNCYDYLPFSTVQTPIFPPNQHIYALEIEGQIIGVHRWGMSPWFSHQHPELLTMTPEDTYVYMIEAAWNRLGK
jgi:hypothetical protein